MADPRDELLRQMRAIRERLDPDLLERAGQAAEAIQSGKAKSTPVPAPEPEMVPYDKEAARAAVMSFLQARHDGGQFAQKLMEAMKRGDDAQRAYGGAAPGKPTRPARKV